MDKGKPIIDLANCICCTVCIYTCPFGSLEKFPLQRKGYIDAAPRLKEQNKCNGCGLCATACPVDVITIK